MKTESKKSIVFAAIISLLTSTYAAFLKTIMEQGISSEHFVINWFRQIPKIYLFILPFVLITGPFVKALVTWIFRNEKPTKTSKEQSYWKDFFHTMKYRYRKR